MQAKRNLCQCGNKLRVMCVFSHTNFKLPIDILRKQLKEYVSVRYLILETQRGMVDDIQESHTNFYIKECKCLHEFLKTLQTLTAREANNSKFCIALT